MSGRFVRSSKYRKLPSPLLARNLTGRRPRLRTTNAKGRLRTTSPPRPLKAAYSDRTNAMITSVSLEMPGTPTSSRFVTVTAPQSPAAPEPPNIPSGQSSLSLRELGSWWRRCFRCDSSPRARQTPRADTLVSWPHRCRSRYGLVRLPPLVAKVGKANVFRNPFNDDLLASGSDDGRVCFFFNPNQWR